MPEFRIITGCPRSGTSLAMTIMRHALGPDAIHGEEWPMLEAQNRRKAKRAGETDEQYQLRLRILEQRGDAISADREEHIRRMNPLGFWECQYTMRGIRWHEGIEQNSGRIVKVVSQGIARTDPGMVQKMIVMMRHPRVVAHSQEDLERSAPVDLSGMTFHSPMMWINVTAQLARWIDRHRVPYLLVRYEDLVGENSNEVAASMVTWFNGTLAQAGIAGQVIRQSLNRSKPQPVESPLWELADAMHEAFLRGDMKRVVTLASTSNELKRENSQFTCLRLNTIVSPKQCDLCLTRKEVRKNFRIEADRKGVKWWLEPCVYECGYGGGDKSIADSVEHNHWLDVKGDSDMGCENCGSLIRRATKAAKAAVKVALNIDRAPMRVALERRLECESCNERQGTKCSVCKCFIKLKTAVLSEHCPRDKW